MYGGLYIWRNKILNGQKWQIVCFEITKQSPYGLFAQMSMIINVFYLLIPNQK